RMFDARLLRTFNDDGDPPTTLSPAAREISLLSNTSRAGFWVNTIRPCSWHEVPDQRPRPRVLRTVRFAPDTEVTIRWWWPSTAAWSVVTGWVVATVTAGPRPVEHQWPV